jgi:large subunit ribosomal protein L3
MAGHMGAGANTTQNLEIIRIDADRQLLLIRGALPGSRGGDVTVKPTVRAVRVTMAPKPTAKPAARAEAKSAAKPEAKPAAKPAAK